MSSSSSSLPSSSSSSSLMPCPSTIWPNDDILYGTYKGNYPLPKERKDHFLKTVERSDVVVVACSDNKLKEEDISFCKGVEEEISWLKENGSKLFNNDLDKHGVIHFRGFHISKNQSGLRQFVDAAFSPFIQPCEDPLSSIGIRSFLSASDGVYRAVDGESVSSTFIGLHNDATYKLAAPYAAFGCFQQATESGGEFLLADGREILRKLRPDIVRRLCKTGLRVRVAGLPLQFLAYDDDDDNNGATTTATATSKLHKFGKDTIANLIERLVRLGVSKAFPLLKLEVYWNQNRSILQILEPKKSPWNTHPRSSKEPTFFSGIHSQSSYLQQKRKKLQGEEGVVSFGGTDVFYGEEKNDNGEMTKVIEPEILDHIEEVINGCTYSILMEPGDVVLLDSYQVLHGRNVFSGQREHGVIWLATTTNNNTEEKI